MGIKYLVCDIDGVICDYDWPRITKEYLGMPINREQIGSYGLEALLGLPHETVSNMFNDVVHAPPIFLPGAVETLHKLMANNWYIALYSKRLQFMTYFNLCLWARLYSIPHDEVISDVDNIPQYVHAALDDSVEKLMNLDWDITVGKLLLFSQPWNRVCLDINNKLTRVANWDEVWNQLRGDT